MAIELTTELSAALFIVGGIIVIAVPEIIAYIIGAVLILKGVIDLFEGIENK